MPDVLKGHLRVALFLLLLPGCAVTPPEQWRTGWQDGCEWSLTHIPLRPVWASPTLSVADYCGAGFNACAKYDFIAGTCLIITGLPEADAPAWLASHERRHCAGWSHAGYC